MARQPSQLFSFANSLNAIMDSTVHIERSLRQEDDTQAKQMRSQLQSDNYTKSLQPEAKLLCHKEAMNIVGVFKPTVMLTTHVHRLLKGAFCGAQGYCVAPRSILLM